MFLKTKCIQYWPDLEASMDCDILTLKTTEERRYAYNVIRRLNIKHRQIVQGHLVMQTEINKKLIMLK